MMDDNQNKNSNNNKNRKNVNGLLILIAWAIGLTVIINYLSAVSRQSANAATTHEVMYSEFKDLVRDGKVESVLFKDGLLEITTVEGYIYTDEDGREYDKDFTLFTNQMGIYDPNLLELLDQYGVEKYTNPYVPEMSPVLEFMVAYILPMVILVGVFMLFMN
ncbi:MAG: ATP-dependent metallopeptidase FtsH/Yme1/Tma family protein, partial [Oscillospiraceae bacterium]|nr:ATP-dependent metallopeptidase FtsH/Yme1/Tma family protein [Oscillospiraceae bacterium]